MAINYPNLKTELDTGHPDQGAYNVDNQLAADQLNAVGAYTDWTRPADATAGSLYRYVAANRSKLAAEANPTPLLGRLKEITETAIAANTSWGQAVEKEHKHAASLFWSLIHREAEAPINLAAAELDDSYTLMGPPGGSIGTPPDDVPGIGVWKDPDIQAMKNLTLGQQSRAQEISVELNYNGLITESHVQYARSLP